MPLSISISRIRANSSGDEQSCGKGDTVSFRPSCGPVSHASTDAADGSFHAGSCPQIGGSVKESSRVIAARCRQLTDERAMAAAAIIGDQ